jgi:hypothetical protein
MAAGVAFGQLLKQIAAPALTSGALSGFVSLLGGASPGQAAASSLLDTAASAGSIGLLRKLRPKSYSTQRIKDLDTGEVNTVNKTSKLETPLNIAASLGTSYVTAPLIYGGQQEQIEQQILQRSLVNNLPLEQEIASLSPGTQYQLPEAQFQQLLNQVPNSSWMQHLTPQEQEELISALNPRMM